MIAALHTGPETHLDHLAPLCALLEIPLIVTEKAHVALARKFYPMIQIQYQPFQDLSLAYMAQSFTCILTCGKFWAMELKPLLKLFFQKELSFIFVPHGYSDKEELLNHPIVQDMELVYKSKENAVSIGNIRKWFYEKHKTHFDRLAAPFFSSSKTTVLYAPTWETKATETSFFERVQEIVTLLADRVHLLIKPHPLLEENNPGLFHRLIETYKQEATFILGFPTIYPLLQKTDVYLGDYSSIGYDFLAYNRPMFFLKEGRGLQNCGQVFSGSIANRQNELAQIRMEVYKSTFDEKVEYHKVKALLKKVRL